MSQNLVPLDGGRTQVVVSPTYTPGFNLSPQYTTVKKLTPAPTEWIPGGRPIYDRLPSASELYKLYFGPDDSYAYVYIPPGFSSLGVGSMQVEASGENKYMVIQSGVVVWKYGQNPINSVIVDLQLLDMRSTRYLIAYQLFYDDSVFAAEYSVEDFSLAGYEMNVGSGTDTVIGWRYTPVYAFTDSDTETWRNYDGMFPTYSDEASLYWQSEYSHAYSSIKLRCPANSAVSGTASLYYQVCPASNEVEIYCTNPEWDFQYTVEVKRDSDGQYFEFPIQYPSQQYGWKVTWSDPKVSIKNITVSGVLTLKRKPVTPLIYCQLVAYPENVVPETITNLEGEEVPLILCKLAYVDVNNVYQIEKIQDIRETVNTSYQPIADWLTKTWDENLINLYTQVENFPTLWMNPETCMKQEYLTLSDSLVVVEN
jgi:hypothetical protein